MPQFYFDSLFSRVSSETGQKSQLAITVKNIPRLHPLLILPNSFLIRRQTELQASFAFVVQVHSFSYLSVTTS